MADSLMKKILAVDDEETALFFVSRILERAGYQVVKTSKAKEAVDLALKEKPDVILLDIVMPEMNGRELAERIQLMRPEIKCLYMSGYTADVIAHQGMVDEHVNFIQKPFLLRALAAKLREVLEG